MAKKNTPATPTAAATTTTVTITEEQGGIVLGALYDKLFDCQRYLSGNKPTDEPSPEDTCCTTHLIRYEQRKDLYRSLLAQETAVRATIALFPEKAEKHE